MADLKTTYKDDVLNTSANEKRKYNMIQNADGTFSLEDVTSYTQVGDSFGAADINTTNKKVNEIDSSLTASDNLQFHFATDGEGTYGFLGADGSLIPFKSEPAVISKTATWSGNDRITYKKISQTVNIGAGKKFVKVYLTDTSVGYNMVSGDTGATYSSGLSYSYNSLTGDLSITFNFTNNSSNHVFTSIQANYVIVSC